MKSKKIFIFGAGSSSRDILRLIQDINADQPIWEVMGYVDSDPNFHGAKIDSLRVYKQDELVESNEFFGVCGMLDPKLRKKIVSNEILSKGYQLPTLIHPTVLKSEDIIVKPGAIIFGGGHISFNVNIDSCVHIAFNCGIGHDVKIGEFTSLMPSCTINGRSSIGSGTIIGAGVDIHQGISVGNNAIVGIGSAITKNVDDDVSITDFPRKIIRNLKE